MRARTRFLVASLTSGRSCIAFDTVTADTPRSRAMSFNRTITGFSLTSEGESRRKLQAPLQMIDDCLTLALSYRRTWDAREIGGNTVDCGLLSLLPLLFGLVNRLPELRDCGQRGRVQRVLGHRPPYSGRVERVFISAAINFQSVFRRTNLSANLRRSFLRPKLGSAESWGMGLPTDANVPITRLENHRTIVGR